jgi:hypothetical protein
LVHACNNQLGICDQDEIDACAGCVNVVDDDTIVVEVGAFSEFTLRKCFGKWVASAD